MAIRTRITLPLCTLVAAMLLVAPAAMADPPASCTTSDGLWHVSAAGPSLVSCDSVAWLGIDYTISAIAPNSGMPDHVATLVGGTNREDVLVPSGIQVYAPCQGDAVTGLGKDACQEMAVKVNPAPYKQVFPLVVRGAAPTTTTIAVKKGKKPAGMCQIVGLTTLLNGVNDFQTVRTSEVLRFKGCSVRFEYDPVTGDVLGDPVLLPPPDSSHDLCSENGNTKPCCTLEINDSGTLEVFLGNTSLGKGKFGEGYISTGSNSCTTRIIGGRVYTWGDPCPE